MSVCLSLSPSFLPSLSLFLSLLKKKKILDCINCVILIEKVIFKNLNCFCDSSDVAGPLHLLTFQKHTSNICGIVGLPTLINSILLKLP